MVVGQDLGAAAYVRVNWVHADTDWTAANQFKAFQSAFLLDFAFYNCEGVVVAVEVAAYPTPTVVDAMVYGDAFCAVLVDDYCTCCEVQPRFAGER